MGHEIPEVDWEDLNNGASKAELCIRMLFGDRWGNRECYKKAWFMVAVRPHTEQGQYRIYLNSDPDTGRTINAADLLSAKEQGLHYLFDFIGRSWFPELFKLNKWEEK
jgi:hypothetical protein